MILSLIPDVIKLPAAIVLGAAIAFYPAKWIGQSEARQAAATAALQTSVTVLRERNAINDQVTASDAGALCAALGLSDDETTECMRRMAETTGEPADGGSDTQDRSPVCRAGSKP